MKSSSFVFFLSQLVVAFSRFLKSYALSICKKSVKERRDDETKDENICFLQTDTFIFFGMKNLVLVQFSTMPTTSTWCKNKLANRNEEPREHRMFAIDGESFFFSVSSTSDDEDSKYIKNCYINNSFSPQIISHTLLSTREEFSSQNTICEWKFFSLCGRPDDLRPMFT